jgi:hypothetical protein
MRYSPLAGDGIIILSALRKALGECDAELGGLLDRMQGHLERSAPAEELAAALRQQWGVSGYIYRSVPLALYCWLRSPGDFRQALEEAIALGGDTDTVGAIVGGVAGASVGADGIPAEWLAGIMEWPRSVGWLRKLAAQLAARLAEENGPQREPVPLFWPGLVPRNLFFLAVVLAHGFRRLLPPY